MTIDWNNPEAKASVRNFRTKVLERHLEVESLLVGVLNHIFMMKHRKFTEQNAEELGHLLLLFEKEILPTAFERKVRILKDALNTSSLKLNSVIVSFGSLDPSSKDYFLTVREEKMQRKDFIAKLSKINAFRNHLLHQHVLDLSHFPTQQNWKKTHVDMEKEGTIEEFEKEAQTILSAFQLLFQSLHDPSQT